MPRLVSSDRKGSSISSMPTPTEMLVPKDRNEIFNVTLVNEKTGDFSFDRYSRSCPDNSKNATSI